MLGGAPSRNSSDRDLIKNLPVPAGPIRRVITAMFESPVEFDSEMESLSRFLNSLEAGGEVADDEAPRDEAVPQEQAGAEQLASSSQDQASVEQSGSGYQASDQQGKPESSTGYQARVNQSSGYQGSSVDDDKPPCEDEKEKVGSRRSPSTSDPSSPSRGDAPASPIRASNPNSPDQASFELSPSSGLSEWPPSLDMDVLASFNVVEEVCGESVSVRTRSWIPNRVLGQYPHWPLNS